VCRVNTELSLPGVLPCIAQLAPGFYLSQFRRQAKHPFTPFSSSLSLTCQSRIIPKFTTKYYLRGR